MARKVYTGEGHFHYVTFSCCGIRKLLKDKEAKQIVTQQRRYHDFNLYGERKLIAKFEYMHQNPVRAGIVEKASDYLWSSCQFYKEGRSVGVTITKCA